MHEWHVKYSEVKKEGSRISCGMYEASFYAKDEDEVRQIMAEEEPEMRISSITKGEFIGNY